MALDDYFNAPSQDCLARLFDAINSMDLAGAPKLSRHERLIMRTSDRKDVFAEKFAAAPPPSHTDALAVPVAATKHRPTLSWDSRTSDESIGPKARDRAGTESDVRAQPRPPTPPKTDGSFSLDGSAVWVEGESAEGGLARRNTNTARGRRSTDASSSSEGRKDEYFPASGASLVKDTRSYQTYIAYKGHQLPIKMPVDTFPEEVGDVRIRLCHLCTLHSADSCAIVLAHPVDHNVHVCNRDRAGTAAPAPALERCTHTANHRSLQCTHHRKAHACPWARSPRWPSIQSRPCCVCTCIWLRRSIAWVCRACIPICELTQQGGVGNCVRVLAQAVRTSTENTLQTGLHRRRDKSHLRVVWLLGHLVRH
jgi:hypothetical protein